MKVSKEALDGAVEQGILESDQAEALLDYLWTPPVDEPRFDFTHVLYYLGGLIAIGR